MPLSSNDLARAISTDPCISYWLKDALPSLARRDCVDAYHDALVLLEYARRTCEENGIPIDMKSGLVAFHDSCEDMIRMVKG